MRGAWLVIVLGLGGCRQVFGLDEPAGVGDAGVVDATDAFVSIDAPDAGPCMGVSTACAGSDTLRTCTGVGDFPTDTVCAWGCDDSGNAAQCNQLAPAGGILGSNELQSTAAIVDVTLTGNLTIDTDTGAIGAVRAAGTGVINGIDFTSTTTASVFTVKSLTITGTVVGQGSRPLVIVSLGDVSISGTLDARGACAGRDAGPGGGMGASSASSGGGAGGGGGGGGSNDRGGGGGGHGTSGAIGGNSGAGANAPGGAMFGDAAITALVGGSGGGGGGDGAGGGVGGGGGGAVQIVSNGTITIAGNGVINAGGCGGKSTPSNDSGGGGGAGGTILLEATGVDIAGVLAVNGGGGGAGEGGSEGQPGQASRTAALGGTSTPDGGDGGKGGAGGVAPEMGLDQSNAGGGGGAVGRIRINTRTGSVTGTGTMSPSFTDPATTATHGTAAVN